MGLDPGSFSCKMEFFADMTSLQFVVLIARSNISQYSFSRDYKLSFCVCIVVKVHLVVEFCMIEVGKYLLKHFPPNAYLTIF